MSEYIQLYIHSHGGPRRQGSAVDAAEVVSDDFCMGAVMESLEAVGGVGGGRLEAGVPRHIRVEGARHALSLSSRILFLGPPPDASHALGSRTLVRQRDQSPTYLDVGVVEL